MNDQPRRRHGRPEPSWPSSDDQNGPKAEQPQERTGFWSPLWEDDDSSAGAAADGPAWPSAGEATNRPNSKGNGRHGGGDAPAWPSDSDSGQGNGGPARRPGPPPSPRRTPRPTPGPGGPAWPGSDVAADAPVPGARPPGGPPPRVPRPSRPTGPPPPVPGGSDPADPADGPTELLPPVPGQMGPEPALLTHREIGDEEPESFYEDAELVEDFDEDGPLTEDERKARRKKVWRRVRRTAYVLIALGIFGPILGFFIAYQYVDVPDPAAVAAEQGQVATIIYKDDTADLKDNPQLARLLPAGGENRTMVTYEDLKKAPNVLHAVFSAEDKEFMTNPGFDITGVLQAGWNQVTGGTGGGSTITQQYIKKATQNEEKTLTRKALEVVQAYKMNNTYSKPDIITAYLNTIYFGKGAYGISAAAKAYFNKDMAQLSESEAALLAGMIQSPSRFDDQEYMTKRWTFVSDQMVKNNWYDPAKRKASTFPPLYVKQDDGTGGKVGPEGHLRTQVLEELERDAGITEEDLNAHGYVVETTVYRDLQQKMIDSVNEVMAGEPANLRPGSVAVNPRDGAILAYYGGADGVGLDWADAEQEPGSSFKPFDLVAYLQQGKGLGEVFDGSSPRVLGGREVRNSENSNKCGTRCPVDQAMKMSVNTVFYDMALNETGTKKVAEAAKAAGVTAPLMPADGSNPDANISIGGGQTQVSTLDMASAYATFANGGVYIKPHFVTRVLDRAGNEVWKRQEVRNDNPFYTSAEAPNSQQIARNVTESLLPVPAYSKIPCAEGRQCAGKTGTHQYRDTKENAKAWMVGYTPSVSTAVSMSDVQGGPIENAGGSIIYGSGLPGEIWKTFMDKYLKGTPKEKWPKYDPIGKDKADEKPSSSSQPSNTGGQNTSTTTTTDTTTDTTTETTDDDWPLPGGGGGGPGNGPANFQGREPE